MALRRVFQKTVEWFEVPKARNNGARRLCLYLAAAGLALLLAAPAVAAVDITIKPVPPPGLGEKVNAFLRWLAIPAVAGALVVGLVGVRFGKDWGKQLVIVALIGLALLALASVNAIPT